MKKLVLAAIVAIAAIIFACLIALAKKPAQAQVPDVKIIGYAVKPSSGKPGDDFVFIIWVRNDSSGPMTVTIGVFPQYVGENGMSVDRAFRIQSISGAGYLYPCPINDCGPWIVDLAPVLTPGEVRGVEIVAKLSKLEAMETWTQAYIEFSTKPKNPGWVWSDSRTVPVQIIRDTVGIEISIPYPHRVARPGEVVQISGTVTNTGTVPVTVTLDLILPLCAMHKAGSDQNFSPACGGNAEWNISAPNSFMLNPGQTHGFKVFAEISPQAGWGEENPAILRATYPGGSKDIELSVRTPHRVFIPLVLGGR